MRGERWLRWGLVAVGLVAVTAVGAAINLSLLRASDSTPAVGALSARGIPLDRPSTDDHSGSGADRDRARTEGDHSDRTDGRLDRNRSDDDSDHHHHDDDDD